MTANNVSVHKYLQERQNRHHASLDAPASQAMAEQMAASAVMLGQDEQCVDLTAPAEQPSDVAAQSALPAPTTSAASGKSRNTVKTVAAPARSRASTPALEADTSTNGGVIVRGEPAVPLSVLPGHSNIALKFQDRDAAISAMVQSVNWSCPKPDDTIPTTIEKRREYVLRLLLAMMNTEDLKNKGKGKGWMSEDDGEKTEEAEGKKVNLKYSQDAMEKVCWDIVVSTQRNLNLYLNTNSPSTSPSASTTKARPS